MSVDATMILRLVNLASAMFAIVLLIIMERKLRGIWVYSFPLVLWLLHGIVFGIAVLIRNHDLITISTRTLNLWSNTVRLQAYFSIIIILVLLCRKLCERLNE